jgi:hypothetical protein
MYKINGKIILKISRQELDLMVVALKIAVNTITDRGGNSSLYKKLLEGLKDVEKAWQKEEQKHFSKNKGA